MKQQGGGVRLLQAVRCRSVACVDVLLMKADPV